jgi:hypothetical protein
MTMSTIPASSGRTTLRTPGRDVQPHRLATDARSAARLTGRRVHGHWFARRCQRPGDRRHRHGLRIYIQNNGGQSMSSTGTFGSTPTFVTAVLTSPGSPGSNFAYTSPTIPTGSYTITVIAVDNHDFVQQVPRIVHVTVNP